MLTPNKHQADALPDKEDVIHFVIASEKRQFEQLGQTGEQRSPRTKVQSETPLNSLWKAVGLPAFT